jgi:hypothetical protein
VVAAVLVCALLLAGFAIRVDGLGQPPTDFVPERQYHSALLARGYYYDALDSAPRWQRHLAELAADQEKWIEPPAMEVAASIAYRALDGERLWFPRLLAITFWLVGGVFLYATARRIGSRAGALVALAVYLFLPYGVIASRSFQPDSLMVMAMLASVFLIVRYYERPALPRLLAAAAVSALAVLVKPGISLLPIVGAFVALGISARGLRATLTNRSTAIFCAVAVVPTAAYYAYGTLVEDFLSGQAGAKTTPRLLVEPFFWKAWLGRLTDVLGYPGGGMATELAGVLVLALALAAGPFVRGKSARALLLGLLAGYVGYGLVFTVHIHTHTYYSLMIVPILGLALMPLGDALQALLRKRSAVLRLAIPALLALALAVVGWRARVNYTEDFNMPVEQFADIGRSVHHSDRTLVLGQAEMTEYYGWLFGVRWPNSSDLALTAASKGRHRATAPSFADAEERLHREVAAERRSRGRPPRYFIVEDISDLEKQRGLDKYLKATFPLTERSETYLVFDLGRRRGKTR